MSALEQAENLSRADHRRALEAAKREEADDRPILIRCGLVEGCGFWVEGTFGECRAAVEAHRASAHAGVIERRRQEAAEARRQRKLEEAAAKRQRSADLEASRQADRARDRPQPKSAPRPRVRRAAAASRATSAPRPRARARPGPGRAPRANRLLTEERILLVAERRRAGESQAAIVREVWQEWGFASPESAGQCLYQAFKVRGIEFDRAVVLTDEQRLNGLARLGSRKAGGTRAGWLALLEELRSLVDVAFPEPGSGSE